MDWSPLSEAWPQIVYALMALLVVSGAVLGARRLRQDRAQIVPALLFWGGALVLIVLLYSLFGPR